MRKFLIVTSFLLSSVWCSFSDAQELKEFYQGVRPLGMGGVAVAVVNDETALLLNPAGLGRLRNYIFTYLDPEVEAGQHTGQIATHSNSAVYTLDPMVTYLKSKPGMAHQAKVQIFPSLVFPNFGVGLLIKRELAARSSDDGATVAVNYTEDWTGVLGYSLKFFDGIVKLGLAGRYVSRKQILEDVTGSEPEISVAALAGSGTGVALDGGLLITAPVQLLPTLGFVVRDAGTTTYNLGGGFFGTMPGDRPSPTAESWDVGLSLNPIHGNHTRSVIALEYRGVNKALAEGEDYRRRTHVGWEYNIHDQVFLRAGMNQKYWTAGFEIASRWYQFQVATYGEEVATLPHSKEDRRYVTKFSMRF